MTTATSLDNPVFWTPPLLSVAGGESPLPSAQQTYQRTMACHTPAATSDHRSGSSTGQAPAVSDPIYISSDEESGLDENPPTAAIAASATKGCRKTSIGISSQGSCTSPRTASNRLNSPPASTHHMPLGSLPSVAVSASLSPAHNQCPSPRSALSAEREDLPSRDKDSPHASHRASFAGPEIPVLINTHWSLHANAAEQGSTLAVSASQDRLMRDEGAADSITSPISTEETRHSTESVRLVDVHQREVSPDDSAYRPPSSPSMSVLVHKALSRGKPGPVSLATDPATSVVTSISPPGSGQREEVRPLQTTTSDRVKLSRRRTSLKRLRSPAGMDESGDEYQPRRTRRKTTAGDGSKHSRSLRNSRPQPRLLRSRRLQKKAKSKSDATANLSKAGQLHAPASYDEWPLADAVLKCVQNDGTATFQLQFSWATDCATHGSHNHPQSKPLNTSHSAAQASVTPSLENNPAQQDERVSLGNDANVYEVECLLARWGKHCFFLRWSDGTTGWEPRRNILDKRMLSAFEATYEGFEAGVDVVNTRAKGGKRQYCLRWNGRSPKEDSWVNEELLSPGMRLGVQERAATGNETK